MLVCIATLCLDKVDLLMSPWPWSSALYISCSGFRLPWPLASRADFCRESLYLTHFSSTSFFCAVSLLEYIESLPYFFNVCLLYMHLMYAVLRAQKRNWNCNYEWL